MSHPVSGPGSVQEDTAGVTTCLHKFDVVHHGNDVRVRIAAYLGRLSWLRRLYPVNDRFVSFDSAGMSDTYVSIVYPLD